MGGKRRGIPEATASGEQPSYVSYTSDSNLVPAKANDSAKVKPKQPAIDNGPASDRSCTDILCCLIFIAFIVGLVGTAIWAYSDGGDMTIFLTGWDSDGNGCGHSEKTKAYKYLYWPAIDYN